MQAACLICVSAAEIFGGWRGCLCCCCSDDDTTKGARSRRFLHLRLHDLDMERSVMCRLRADVWGGVSVRTGREIQPSLRPQRAVHTESENHNPEVGNPGMDLCVSLSSPSQNLKTDPENHDQKQPQPASSMMRAFALLAPLSLAGE